MDFKQLEGAVEISTVRQSREIHLFALAKFSTLCSTAILRVFSSDFHKFHKPRVKANRAMKITKLSNRDLGKQGSRPSTIF